MATVNERIEQLAITDPGAARKHKDFRTWLDLAEQRPYAHALRLHEDPRRARTHMIFQEIVYTPKASEQAKYKFRIVRCSVFRMADVYGEIERVMGLLPGEGKEYVDGMFEEKTEADLQDSSAYYVVILTCPTRGLPPWLGGVEVAQNYLIHHPYDHEWRRLLNPDVRPVGLQLAGGSIRDAEYDV